MKNRNFSIGSFALLFLLASSLLVACHLSQEEKAENALSFANHYETLSKFAEVSIAVVDPVAGDTTVIYRGKVESRSEIADLDVPGWDGGPIIIVISGYKAGSTVPVFVEKKQYDGKTRATDSILVLVSPNPGLTATSVVLQMVEGQTLSLPQVTISPANLADKGIAWSSDRPEVAAIRGGDLVAVSPGSAQVTAKLHYDTTKSVAFTVTVQADPSAPTSLALDRDTLYLAQHGAPGSFGILVGPANANAAVSWTLSDSSIAGLRSDGSFQGLLPGVTRAIVASKSRPGLHDTGYIQVSEPVLVQQVRFLSDPVTLYLGGSPQTLEVEVMPSKANQEVVLTLTDSSKAVLDGLILTPKQAGTLSVIASSKEDPSKTATLEVTVKQPILVQSVAASADTATLFLKGPGRRLTAQVLPDSAPQGLRWVSLTPGVATVHASTGQVEPVAPGLTLVVASSQADSTRKDTVKVSVKQDTPRLEAGADTAVSAGQTVVFHPVVAQEYGQVVMFKWDLDGDQAWDDSATALKDVSFQYNFAKAYRARLFVRDTEGNEVTVFRQVTVVSGAAVSIEEPKDNSYTNKRTIPVVWYVNNKKQDAQATADLVPGPNEIVRTAKDSAGKEFTARVTVHYDTTAPVKPNLTGTSPTNDKPKWTWSTGGGGGSGDFRFRLGDANFPADAPVTRDTAYILAATPVSGTTYTLFVQERDLAGNWSPAGSLAILFDMTKPVVSITSPQASGTYFTPSAGLILSGTVGGPLPITRVSYKVGAAAAANATFASGSWSTPSIPLQEGVSTVVLVTVLDNAGNSGEASLTLFMDNTAPGAPTITSGPDATTANRTGAFGWTAGGDGASGSGLNGRYRYNLNGGAWKDTSANLLTDLPLVEGNNVFSVQEQDRALLWSTSATRQVKADHSGPIITLSSHTSPVAHGSTAITLSGQVRDTGSGVTTMSVGGQASGSGSVTVTGTTWSTASLALATGANTLVLTATDGVGNARTLNVTVNVNVPAPAVVITYPSDNLALTNKDTITVRYTIAGVAGSRLFNNLAEGASNLIIESAPNVSGNIGRDTVTVTRDATSPLSPTLTITSPTPTKDKAIWTIASRGDNAGGAGMRNPPAFQYQVNGGAWTQTSSTRLEISDEGTFTVVVQEQDKAGNWSASSTARTIQVDKTGPVLGILTRNNFITNTSPASIRFTVDGVEAAAKACTLTVANEANTCTVTGTDNLGNPSNASITVWYRPNTYFIKPGGIGNGSSWESASADLEGILRDQAWENKEVWLASGTYSGYYTQWYNMTVLGGFSLTAHSPAGRNKTGTRIAETHIDFSGNATWDGIVFTSGVEVRGATCTMTDVKFEDGGSWTLPLLQVMYGANLTANNLDISGMTLESFGISIMWASATFNGGSMVANKIPGDFGTAMGAFTSSSLHLKGGFGLYGNTDHNGNRLNGQLEVTGSGTTFTVDNDVTFNCVSELIVGEGASGTCKGTPRP